MRHLLSIAAAFLLLGQAALAANLVIGVPSETTSIDPHYQDLTPNHQITQHIFESLVQTGPNDELIPGLAISWQITLDPTVWNFALRQGVRFTDGAPFTARDVVFSLDRAQDVPGAPSTLKRYLQEIAEVFAVDDHTLRIRTKKPAPTLPSNLAGIGIISAKLPRDVASMMFNKGEGTFGTGPYKLVEYVPGSRVKLAANPDYWGGKPTWDNVTFRLFANRGSRVAALLAGDVDLIADVSANDVPTLEASGKVKVARGPSNRVIFWSMDVARETTPFITDNDDQAIPNPLRDRRVRQAFSLAIDRNLLVDRIMSGFAVPANQIPPVEYGGHDPSIPFPAADPARAKSLLAEAGYPKGFKLTIHTTNDRYPNDSELAQAVAQQLSHVGVTTKVQTMPVALYFGAARKKEFTMAQIGWGQAPGDAGLVMREALRSDSINNYGGWKNERFDALIDEAASETRKTERNALLAAASRVAAEDDALIVTHYQVNVWAAKNDLDVVPRMDEKTLAMSVTHE
jgi:peptide/nickel transport system substrate-binding protein